MQNNRVAIIGIIVTDLESAEEINKILHDYSQYIIGRMGIPYKKRDLSIMSVAIDAPLDKINELGGKLGRLKGVSAQTTFAKI